MSVALLLVTHESIGRNMLNTVASILNHELQNTACVEVPMDADIETVRTEVTGTLANLATETGALILTDSYGSTPCNIAGEFLDNDRRLVSGLNLPMLIRVMNYRSLPLAELEAIAVEGGKNGIISSTH